MRKRPGRLGIVAGVTLALVGLVTGVGATFLGSTSPVTSAATTGGIQALSFLPSSGWTEVSTGTVPILDGPTVIATNGQLAQENGPVGTFPDQTLAKLPADGIVFYVVIGRASDGGPNFPPRQLPLQLSDATVQRGWEGQRNQNVPLYRIDAAVNGYILSAYAFFGTQTPSVTLMHSAQQELDRLEVPTA
jgi:hypothetical protein